MTRTEAVRFCLTRGQLTDILETLIRRRYYVAVGTTGVNHRSGSRLDLILCGAQFFHEAEVSRGIGDLVQRIHPQQPLVVLSYTPYHIVRPQAFEALELSLSPASEPGPVAYILLGSRPGENGQFVGAYVSGGEIVPIHSLQIRGPGMRSVPAVDFRGDAAEPPSPQELEQHSRTIGALGEANWCTLRNLHFVVDGVGRIGSAVARYLAMMGVQHLGLCDPDHIERHNLDMDGVGEGDLGRPKAEAVAESLSREHPLLSATPLVSSAISAEGIRAMKEADFLISCFDNDLARAGAGVVARVYGLPALDIGSGVFEASQGAGTVEMGADIRFLLSDDENGCIFCAVGGIAAPEQVLRALAEPGRPEAGPPRRDWRTERRGSLRSLNQIAVHLGVRMIEDVIAGRLTRSRWLRVTFDPAGMPAIRELHGRRMPGCRVCGAMGLGDLFGFGG